MKKAAITFCLLAFATASVFALPQGFKLIKELLTGYEEVPSLSTTGNGHFNARISNDGTQIEWELSYSDLEGAVRAPSPAPRRRRRSPGPSLRLTLVRIYRPRRRREPRVWIQAR
jgi:hypothetical protein